MDAALHLAAYLGPIERPVTFGKPLPEDVLFHYVLYVGQSAVSRLDDKGSTIFSIHPGERDAGIGKVFIGLELN